MNLHLLGAGGIFSAADAARHGIDRHALSRLCSDARIVRLSRGWYAVVDGEPPKGEELHRLTALALGRQFRARAVISQHSLLLCRRLPTFRADLSTVHLTSGVDDSPAGAGTGRGRRSVTVRRPGLVIHRQVAGIRLAEPTAHDSRPAAIPLALAIVQSGLLAGPESALVPADAALREGLVTAAELTDAVSSFRAHPGIGPIRCALPQADGRHESPGETRAAFLLRALGFGLDPQHEVQCEGRLYRADFRIRGTRVLVEFDGAVKYANPRDLFEEKQREDALRRAGWTVVRLVWADLDHPDRVRARVLDAIARAG
ncbi:type IV toxin-antitoxin system AbiEi family antitoxin domain-containing protein [Intrasporangium oryzae]|uniref:type IV toxin-antitoxin system AbiEi family antitoxin domain-containing protein n=1 Tax=Intrasporangium oryzae TaxID=412687 RepID=UPI0004AE89A4|nr:type IV toxin-antitoxin system AbiEi family antitoxin domain-containing protein [Intrasporangium oryzae]